MYSMKLLSETIDDLPVNMYDDTKSQLSNTLRNALIMSLFLCYLLIASTLCCMSFCTVALHYTLCIRAIQKNA